LGHVCAEVGSAVWPVIDISPPPASTQSDSAAASAGAYARDSWSMMMTSYAARVCASTTAGSIRSVLVPCRLSHMTNCDDASEPGCPNSAIRRQSQMPSPATSMSSTKPLQSSSTPSHVCSSAATGVQSTPVALASPRSKSGPSPLPSEDGSVVSATLEVESSADVVGAVVLPPCVSPMDPMPVIAGVSPLDGLVQPTTRINAIGARLFITRDSTSPSHRPPPCVMVFAMSGLRIARSRCHW
jgi:hypothetical protein